MYIVLQLSTGVFQIRDSDRNVVAVCFTEKDANTVRDALNAAQQSVQSDLVVCTCDEPIPTREFRTCNRCEKRIAQAADAIR